MADKIQHTDDEWREQLAPDEYRVLRCSATEPPFTGEYWDHHESGDYLCRACGALLYDAKDKYDSGTGWPSFTRPAEKAAVDAKADTSHGMVRTEVVCARCGSHLGHVFEDGPAPTGQRYCMNSAALKFERRG